MRQVQWPLLRSRNAAYLLLSGLAIGSFTVCLQAAHATDKIFELWRGVVIDRDYRCADYGTSGIILDGTSTIDANSPIVVACNKVIFRQGSALISYQDLTFETSNLSGPLKIIGMTKLRRTAASGSPVAAGRPGRNGARGRNGKAAPAAPLAPWISFPPTKAIGSPGQNGRPGKHGQAGVRGQDGQPGKRGPNIVIQLGVIEAGSSVTVTSEGSPGLDGGDGGRGGDGGKGGRGGIGGAGSSGNANFLPGQGGRGGNGGTGGNSGDGGRGGSGGKGGRGGSISISFDAASYQHTNLVTLNAVSVGGTGGQGGLGGAPGKPGLGGVRGLGGRHDESIHFLKGPASISDVKRGFGPQNGSSGHAGKRGKVGRIGERGLSGWQGARGFVSWGDGPIDLQDLLRKLRN